MNKKIGMLGIIGAAVIAMALMSACGSNNGDATPAAANNESAPAVDIPATTAPEISPERAAVITAGDDWIAKMRIQADAYAKSMAALKTLTDTNFMDPNLDAVTTANNEATAASTLASTNLTAASTTWNDALGKCHDCLDLASAHMQLISAQASLMTATDTTRPGAEQALTDAVAKWNAAKVV